MLEEKNILEPDHEFSANNHSCTGADNTMEQFFDPFLLVPQQTEATRKTKIYRQDVFLIHPQ